MQDDFILAVFAAPRDANGFAVLPGGLNQGVRLHLVFKPDVNADDLCRFPVRVILNALNDSGAPFRSRVFIQRLTPPQDFFPQF